jgi:hypothetical protein
LDLESREPAAGDAIAFDYTTEVGQLRFDQVHRFGIGPEIGNGITSATVESYAG